MPFAAAMVQAQKPLILSKPDVEFAEPFSAIAGTRELKDGRLIVIDRRDKLVQIVDLKSGATRIGREGTGPGEYLLPNALVALPADSTAVWDGMNRRYMLLSPEGKYVREFRLQPPEGLSNRGYGPFSATFPRGVDAKGNIYFQGSPFTGSGATQAVADSIPIIRFNRATQRPETTAYVRPPAGNAAIGPSQSGGPGTSISNGVAHPLTPLDEWTALPNGTVAVVRGENYRMDLYATRSSMTRGALAPIVRHAVDDAVRAMVLADRRQQLGEMTPRSRPGGGDDPTAGVPSRVVARMLNLDPWPEFMPPFFRGAAIARPLGATAQVWVLRALRSATDSSRYDVFDATGKPAGSVVLSPRTTVIGFGQGTVYAIRTDDDGLQFLQRYRLAMEAKLSG